MISHTRRSLDALGRINQRFVNPVDAEPCLHQYAPRLAMPSSGIPRVVSCGGDDGHGGKHAGTIVVDGRERRYVWDSGDDGPGPVRPVHECPICRREGCSWERHEPPLTAGVSRADRGFMPGEPAA